MDYLTIRLKKNVSLVVLPIDDFTELPITGSVIRMYTEDKRYTSIRKEEGYHVFCDLKGDTIKICIESPLYQKQTICFPLEETIKVHTIRMMPNAYYPLPAGATCVRGTLEPGSRIRLFFPEQKKNYKLLYDYTQKKQEASLSLFCPERAELSGKTLFIKNASGKGEFFRVKNQVEEECELEQSLSRSYKKIGTSVYPVYEAVADENGLFYLLIRSVPVEVESCSYLISDADGMNEHGDTLVLKIGTENWIREESV